MGTVGNKVTLFALGSGNWVAGGRVGGRFLLYTFLSFEFECIFHLKNKIKDN